MIETEIILRLILASILGALIGIERETFHKPAGLRTHVFVAMGAALFTIISVEGLPHMYDVNQYNYDPSRIISAILMGIGFIGGGVIIHRLEHVEGITTAAGLWVATGIGIATGIGYYMVAFTAVIISLITLLGLQQLKPIKTNITSDEE